MNNLGLLLAKRMDPPELEEARGWYLKAADAGHTWGNGQPRLLCWPTGWIRRSWREARQVVPEGRRRRPHPGNEQPRLPAG